MSSNRLSIVICTFNRASLLSRVLKSLTRQTVELSKYECIVVDNKSTDNTPAVVEGFRTVLPNLEYVFESRQGLSHARNLGAMRARGDYIAYIDDDCELPPMWLEVAQDIVNRLSPAAFGGPSYPFYDAPRPAWYKDAYGTSEEFRVPTMLDQETCIYIYGMNMVFKRAVLHASGGFDCKFGMSGNKIAYSEETMLLKHIATTVKDAVFYYDPKLYVYHLVPSRKMKLLWIMRSTFAHGRAAYHYSSDMSASCIGRVVVRIGREVRGLTQDVIGGLLTRDRRKYPYIQNFLYEEASRRVYTMGTLCEQLCQLKHLLASAKRETCS